MAAVEHVTVTLPDDLLLDIDRREKDRSTFVAEAVRRELDRQRRAELRLSLQSPHPESAEVAELGFEEWAQGLRDEDTETLVDSKAERPLRRIPGKIEHQYTYTQTILGRSLKYTYESGYLGGQHK